MPSIINSDDGVVSGTSGLKTTGGNDGILALQNNGTTNVTVTAAGNSGFGTASPTAKVHIWQTGAATSLNIDGTENPIFAARYASNADGATIFLAKSRNSTVGSQTIIQNGDEIGVLKARGSNGSAFVDAASITFAVDGTPGSGNDMPGRIVFGTSADGTSSITERGRFDSLGSLLLGKTNSTATTRGISLAGTGGATFVDSQTGDGPQIQVCNIWSSVLNGYRFFSFRINAGANEVGSISTNGSNNTSYNTSSDYRLKENVQPMTGALAKVAALKPVTYKWKSDGSDGEGFIAHELAEVCPQAVTGEKDAVDDEGKPKHQGVDTSFLVATLTAAIQELKAELDATKAQVAALQAKVQA
jgi:hypothetical protein